MSQPVKLFRMTAEPKPEGTTIVRDSREQHPWEPEFFAPMRMEVATLQTGDYSMKGLEAICAIERKSESDLISCVGLERSRFDKEVQRLLAYPVRCLIVESTWERMERGEWLSKVTPAAAIGSLLGWVAMGLPVIMADSRERAAKYAARILFTAARRRWREARALVADVLEIPEVES